MRQAAVIACLLAAACATAQAPRPDAFVIAGDACGASRFAHLVGEEFAEMHRAAMPQDANVIDAAARTTLEYTPGRLNVVLDQQGRIVAIGCF